MKNISIFLVLAFTMLSCGRDGKDVIQGDQANADSLAEPLSLTPEEKIAQAEANELVNQIADKLDNNDKASVTNLIDQAEARIDELIKQGDVDVTATYSAIVKNFLDENKSKLVDMNVSTDNIEAIISKVPGLEEALKKVRSASYEKKAEESITNAVKEADAETPQTKSQPTSVSSENSSSNVESSEASANESEESSGISANGSDQEESNAENAGASTEKVSESGDAAKEKSTETSEPVKEAQKD